MVADNVNYFLTDTLSNRSCARTRNFGGKLCINLAQTSKFSGGLEQKLSRLCKLKIKLVELSI